MWSPDDLDVQIVRAMASPVSFQWDVRVSLARIARELKVDEETVRNRLRRMQTAGFLQGWHLILNPLLIGRQAAMVELRIGRDEAKAGVIERLKLVEGVTHIDDFYGRELAVRLVYEHERSLERQIQLVAALCEWPNPTWWKLYFPPCGVEPSRTDWRVIQALWRSPRSKLSDVARDLGLSTRTVKRRMTRLIEGNAFYLEPLLDLSKVAGVRGRFWVLCDSSRKHEVDAQIVAGLARIITTHTEPEGYSLFVVHTGNAAQVRDIARWLETLDGVKEVRAHIEVDHIHADGWLTEEVEKQLGASAKSVAAGPPEGEPVPRVASVVVTPRPGERRRRPTPRKSREPRP